MTSTVPQRSATISPQEQAQLDELYAAFEAADMKPLWTQIGDLMPTSPLPDARPDAVAVVHAAAAGRAGRRPGPGRPRRGTPGHRAGQPRPGRHRRTPPRRCGRRSSTSARARRPRAPAHPERVPLRRRGRGRLDRRQRRPGRDAPRRLPAAPRAGTSTATTTRPTSRWPGSTAWTSRSSARSTPASSSSDRTCHDDEATPDVSRSERLWGHPGLTPVGAPAPKASPLIGLPLGAHRPRPAPSSSCSRTRATPASSSPATPPSATPTPPRRATCCRPSAPSSTASARAPEHADRREVGSRSARSSRAPASSRVGDERVPGRQGRPVRRPVLGAVVAVRGRATPVRPVPLQRRPHLRELFSLAPYTRGRSPS